MAWAIPDPPDDSCFVLDKDDHGYPRLSWNLPEGPSRDFGKAFLGFWLIVWILGGLAVLVALLFGNWQRGEGIGVFIWLVGWAAMIFLVGKILFRYLIDPDPETLTLTDKVLKYDPGFSNYYRIIAWRGIFTARKKEVPRYQIARIHREKGPFFWGRLKPLSVLKIRFGYDELQLGPSLNDSDSQWLAGVLTNWVDRDSPHPVSIPSSTRPSQPAAPPKCP